MIVVLNHKYKKGSDNFLNYIALGSYDTQDDIAREFNVSKKTIGRWISSLRKNKLLITHRYKNNNFIYMVGEDAKEDWSSYEARHIAVYRKHKFDIEEVDAETSLLYPLFKDEHFSMRGTNIAQSLEFSKSEIELLDIEVDILIQDLRS